MMRFSLVKGILPVMASVCCLVWSCEKGEQSFSVDLSKSGVSLQAGETYKLEVSVYPAGAELSWFSSDETVVTVDQEGTITAVAEGNAVVTVACGDAKDECSVTVSAASVPVESVTLDAEGLELFIGETDTLTATVLPEDASDNTVVWTSSNEAVATVSGGVVTAVAVGETKITASAGGYDAICTVTVIDAVAMGEDENFRIVVERFFDEDDVRYVQIAWYPTDKEMVYFPFMTQATLYEGRTDEQFVEEYYATLAMMAQMYGYSFEEYLGAFLKTGDFAGASVVPAKEKYYAIAYGCGYDGTLTTSLLAVGFVAE